MTFSPTKRRLLLTIGAVAALVASGMTAAHGDTPDQIANGTFDDGVTGWTAYPNPSVQDGRGCVDVPTKADPYSAGILQKVPLVAGETYALSLDVTASSANDDSIRLIVQGGPDVEYKAFLPIQRLSLTPESQTLEFTFTPDIDYDRAELGVQQDVATDEGFQLCIDNVSLKGGAEPEEYAPDTGPAVRVNQVGYDVKGPKMATVVTDATDPQTWVLSDGAGTAVAEGQTVPEGVDPSAGINVHTVDFTDVSVEGQGFTLTVGDLTSHPFAIGTGLLNSLRIDSKTFYYTNRSGIAIDDALAPGYGRPAGHVGVDPNKGDLAVGCQSLDDDSQKLLDEPWTCDSTHDVSGGWYDAGDHGKYVVNAGISVAQLMMEYERNPAAYTDSMLSIPEAGNGVPDLLDEVRWELEWMLKMQVSDGQYAGMAYHKVADANWTGLPLLPSDDPQTRVLYRPSTAATLNLSAAAAQGARLFEEFDADFAAQLLAASKTAYTAALETPELYAPAADPEVDPNPGSGPYDDDDATDEFYWAAAELYLSTGGDDYLAAVQASKHHTGDIFTGDGLYWANVAPLGRMDLATVESELPDRDRVRTSIVEAADAYVADADQPFGQIYGEENYVWGSNSAMLNSMQVIGTAGDITGVAKYGRAVVGGMDYILGRNALNRSYVTGYGTTDVRNQHHRWYSNQLDKKLPNPPRGTVAGGPNSTATQTGDPVAAELLQGCLHQFCYVDDIGSWSTNEITINWNSGLSWVGGYLADLDLSGDVAPTPTPSPSPSASPSPSTPASPTPSKSPTPSQSPTMKPSVSPKPTRPTDSPGLPSTGN